MNQIKRLINNGSNSGSGGGGSSNNSSNSSSSGNSSDNLSSVSDDSKASTVSPASAQEKGAPRNAAFNVFLRGGQQMKPHRPASTVTLDKSPSIPAFHASQGYLSSRNNALVRSFSHDSAYFGPCSSVSSLGLETGLSTDNDHMSSSSSSEEDEGYYDADDLISLSRRQSISVSNNNTQQNGNGSKSSQERFNGFFKRSFSSSSGSDAYMSAGPTRTTTRRFISDVKSLRPKVKSFLRISKELQDELSPLDCEIKQEAKVTNLLRVDDNDECGSASSLFMSPLPPPSLPLPGLADGGSGGRSMDSPSAKRKSILIDEAQEPVYVKRRAVSPGNMSPVMGSPTRSLKHLRDTSNGLERMRLV